MVRLLSCFRLHRFLFFFFFFAEKPTSLLEEKTSLYEMTLDIILITSFFSKVFEVSVKVFKIIRS